MSPITYDGADELKEEANNAANNFWNPQLPPVSPIPANPSIGTNQPTLQNRFTTAGVTFPTQKPDTDAEWKAYHENYAAMVRREAIQKFADRMANATNHGTMSAATTSDLEDAMNHWRVGVRLHDELNPTQHLFKDKPRGHGQEDGSTDGRLLRKLMMAAAQRVVSIEGNNNPDLSSFYNDAKRDRDRLNTAKQNLKNNPLNNIAIQDVADAEERLSRSNRVLSLKVTDVLNNLLRRPGGSLALKKALFLTKEKLSDPLGYKQKYARLVPFGDSGWVKASRRFHTPANKELALLPRKGGTARNAEVVRMGPPPNALNLGFNKYAPTELIEDVGQKDLGECWLQAAAASLPRRTLGNMFSWRLSYGSEGVTTRLHDEKGNPIYIRTPQNMLWDAETDPKKRVFNHKAVWPAALATAAAKVGDSALTQFRREQGDLPRHADSGLPLYSVRDLTGSKKNVKVAARLLTGKDPIVFKDVSGHWRFYKRKHLSRAWANVKDKYTAIGERPRGVASFSNFSNKKVSGKRPSHATTWLGISRNGKEGTFGNTWMPGGNKKSVSKGKKIFDKDLSRVKSVGFLDPNGADPSKDKYLPSPAHRDGNPRNLLGNIPI